MSSPPERPLVRFEVGASQQPLEVALQEKDGSHFVAIKAAGGGVTIPAAMLPELKRALSSIEDALAADSLFEGFENKTARRGRPPVFANDSEREFAALLDFYQLRWSYEPATFPIVWNSHGRVTESFTPDFYLKDFNLFIELTTLKQSLVTRKNRKVRLFRKHYQDRPIRIFYGKDYHALITKYGLAPAGGRGGRATSQFPAPGNHGGY
ncbi:MAG: hypothetical protein V2A77_02075 [Pseudomonadota bacterium]